MEINEEKATMGNKKDEQSDKLKRKQMRSLIEKNTRKKKLKLFQTTNSILWGTWRWIMWPTRFIFSSRLLERLNPEVVSPREFILHTRTRIAFDDNYLKEKRTR